jgi:hypothetical protein
MLSNEFAPMGAAATENIIATVAKGPIGVPAQDCSVDVCMHLDGGMTLPIGLAATNAAGMFCEIGIKVRMWEDTPSCDPGRACGKPIRIDFKNARDRTAASGGLAYAQGTSIHVFVDRVQHGRDPNFAITVLAYVIAHEITHVLQGITRHSEEGIMKSKWTLKDYYQMRTRRFAFSPEDVDLIYEGIAKRIFGALIPGRYPPGKAR